jgi:hypothetical protein
MGSEHLHPPDQDLLLSADGELSPRRAAEIREHLAECWNCRARMAEIEATIADFVRAGWNATELPPSDGPRALLKARIKELPQLRASNAWSALALTSRRFAYVAALGLIIVAVGAGIVLQRVFQPDFQRATGLEVTSLPNHNLTPGSSRPVALTQLCSVTYDDVVRTVPSDLQQQVFEEYGLTTARAADYEVDYLITPGLGGSDDVKNLWPQPHSDTVWNSYVKDQLENRLHNLVCGGEVDLTTAQRDISQDWVAAYKKYFHTDKPLPARS